MPAVVRTNTGSVAAVAGEGSQGLDHSAAPRLLECRLGNAGVDSGNQATASTYAAQLVRNVSPHTMAITKALVDLSPGNSFVVCIDGSHYTFSRLANGGVKIRDGFQQTERPTEVRRAEQRLQVKGALQLCEGDKIVLGTHVEVVFGPANGNFHSQQRARWAQVQKAKPGDIILVGSNRGSGWSLQEPGAEQTHCLLRRANDGRWFLHNQLGNSAVESGLSFESGGHTTRAPRGQALVINGGHALKIHGLDLVVLPFEFAQPLEGERGRCVRSDGSRSWMLSNSRSGADSSSYRLDKYSLTINGIPEAQGQAIARALTESKTRGVKLPDAIVVVDMIGYEFKTGQGCVPIKALAEIDPTGNVLTLSRSEISDHEKVLSHLLAFADRQAQTAHLAEMRQHRDVSIRAADYANTQVNAGTLPAGAWLIDRNSAVSGGLRVSNYPSAQYKNVVLYVDPKDVRLTQMVDTFLIKCGLPLNTSRTLDFAEQHKLLGEFSLYVKEELCTNTPLINAMPNLVQTGALPSTYGKFNKADLNANPWLIPYFVMRQSPPQINGQTLVVRLGGYPAAGVGMCEEMALLTAFFAEECQRRGLISPTAKVSYNCNYADLPPAMRTRLGADLVQRLPSMPGHGWCEVDWRDGVVMVYDPAQGYQGPPIPDRASATSRWLYANEQQQVDALQAPL